MKARSQKRIELDDLRRLGEIALENLADLFARRPQIRHHYERRLLCVCLCQGAALHFIDHRNGINDFDVYSFFREHPDGPFPYRGYPNRDFGDSKFGVSPDQTDFVGRPVDLLRRSIPCKNSRDPIDTVRNYLELSKTGTARFLAAKAVIGIYPSSLLGKVIWPCECVG